MKAMAAQDVSGVYVIVNTETGEEYIGQSGAIKCRLAMHRSDLRRGIHGNPRLQAAWSRYGESSFRMEVLRELSCKTTPYGLQLAETLLIRQRHPAYNIAKAVCGMSDAELEAQIQAEVNDGNYMTLYQARSMLGVSRLCLSRLIRKGTLEVLDNPLDRRTKYVRREQIVSLASRQLTPDVS